MKIDVNEILYRILKNRKESIVIFDFDYTITNKESNSSIGVFTKYLPIKYQLKKQKIDALTLKTNTKLSYYMIWKYKLKLLSKYYSTSLLNCIDLKTEFQFNKEIYKFIIELQKNNIPIVIYSSGIKDIIERFLILNDISLLGISIIANSIDLNTQKIVSKIITPKNKRLSNIDKKYKYIFGDRVEDLNIVNDSIKFLVDDNNIEIME